VTAPRHPLQIFDYRLFWLSRFAAVLATTGMLVVLGWQVYDLARGAYGMSRSAAAFQLGLLGLVQFLPLFLLTPVAGLVADHFDRRRVAGLAILVDAAIALTLALTTYHNLLSLPLLFGLAALHGAVRVFVGPAMGAIGPNIVPAELLPRSIALSSMAWQSGAIIGPGLAGLLYALTPSLPYAFATAMLATSCIAVFAIRPVPPPLEGRNDHPVRRINQGLQFVWNDRFLLGCITLDLFAVLLGGATALLPVYARDILKVGPEGLGLMRAAPALGATLVAVALAWKPIKHEVGTKMLWGVAIYGAATAVFGFSRWFPLSLAMLALLGAGDMVSVFIRNSLVQLNTPDAMRGRVQATSGLAISASNELGEMQSGLAAALLGATGAVVFGGVAAVLITGLWAWIFPELRNARTFAPQYRQKEPAS
jgi:MFS family permease